jgi:23S rRNA (guanine2445-N2)-methyltransferase / 23S rRNA (guanine2069-N7)-methyltransferase
MSIQFNPDVVMPLFATSPKGLELLLAHELRELGAFDVREKLAGVAFSGNLQLAYRAVLWSRLANRVLLPLKHIAADTPDNLYVGVQGIDWSEHLAPEGTVSVHFISSRSHITHTLFGAQKVKDAIVDQYRERFGVRPTVNRDDPDISVHVYLHKNIAVISLDLSGRSLHKRCYRVAAGNAPIKENLAAAVLLRAQWPRIASQGGALMDPMCGSGTLLIEGAMLAADIAPGLSREYFGFLGWKQHQAEIWDKVLHEARQRAEKGMLSLPKIVGYDNDAEAIQAAFLNIDQAGLRGKIHVEKRDISVFSPIGQYGLVVVNPPYGQRLGEFTTLQPLYTCLGDRLKTMFEGWQAAILTGHSELGKQMGIRAKRYYALFNGALPCQLLLFDILAAYFVDRSPQVENERRIRAAKRLVSDKSKEAVQMFENRLKKNLKHFSRQAKRQGLASYRVYDADIPEYAFSIDISEGSAYVTEYMTKTKFDIKHAEQKRYAVLAVLPALFNLPSTHIYFNSEKIECY